MCTEGLGVDQKPGGGTDGGGWFNSPNLSVSLSGTSAQRRWALERKFENVCFFGALTPSCDCAPCPWGQNGVRKVPGGARALPFCCKGAPVFPGLGLTLWLGAARGTAESRGLPSLSSPSLGLRQPGTTTGSPPSGLLSSPFSSVPWPPPWCGLSRSL